MLYVSHYLVDYLLYLFHISCSLAAFLFLHYSGRAVICDYSLATVPTGSLRQSKTHLLFPHWFRLLLSPSPCSFASSDWLLCINTYHMLTSKSKHGELIYIIARAE